MVGIEAVTKWTTQKAMISKGYHLECRAYELLELKKRHSGQISGHRSDLIHCTLKILTSMKSVHSQKKDQTLLSLSSGNR